MAKKVYVRKGQSVTSLKGIISEGTEVFEKDFKRGEKAIEQLLKPRKKGDKVLPSVLTNSVPEELEVEEVGTKEIAKEAEKADGAKKK